VRASPWARRRPKKGYVAAPGSSARHGSHTRAIALAAAARGRRHEEFRCRLFHRPRRSSSSSSSCRFRHLLVGACRHQTHTPPLRDRREGHGVSRVAAPQQLDPACAGRGAAPKGVRLGQLQGWHQCPHADPQPAHSSMYVGHIIYFGDPARTTFFFVDKSLSVHLPPLC
jgi:hypothetical protein